MAFLAVVLLLLGPARAAEPWTDPNLPVKDGLELWLDATRQNAARQARQLRPLLDGSPLDVWHDGSGRGHHLTQRIPEARPHFKTGTHGAAVRFDGKDDFLSTSNLGRTLTNTTLFIFAAPRSNPVNGSVLDNGYSRLPPTPTSSSQATLTRASRSATKARSATAAPTT